MFSNSISPPRGGLTSKIRSKLICGMSSKVFSARGTFLKPCAASVCGTPSMRMPRADEAPTRSHWQLLEDEILLTPAHASHAEIAELGGGRHSHWTSQLYFSTSDGTDPNNNGKRYALRWAGQEQSGRRGDSLRSP